MKSEGIEEKSGVGLFPQAGYSLSRKVEQNILAFLDINAVIQCAQLNKLPWNRRIADEIRRRKSGITVYVWPGSINSSDYLWWGQAGHSALKTYAGGEEGEGIYVSFYPGDCHEKPRHPSCQEEVSHFHQWNQENRTEAKAVDIYGLDVNEINRTFQQLYFIDPGGKSLRSNKKWSKLYNCSDVILNLLESGGIAKASDLRRYGWKAILLICFVMINLSPSFIRRMFGNKEVIEDNILNLLGIDFRSSWGSYAYLFSRDLVDGAIGSFFASLTTFVYANLTFLKSHLPRSYIARQIKPDVKKTGILSFLAPFAVTIARLISVSSGYMINFFSDSAYHKIELYLIKRCPIGVFSWLSGTEYFESTFNVITLALMLISTAITVAPKFIWDCGTTPDRVLSLINEIKANTNSEHFFSSLFSQRRDLKVVIRENKPNFIC